VRLDELVAHLAAALDVTPRVDWRPAAPGDVEHTFADVTRSEAELGYAPTVPIAEGVRRFVAWLHAADGAAT